MLGKFFLILFYLVFSFNLFSQKSNFEKAGDIIQITLPATAFTSQLFLDKEDSEAITFVKSMGASFIVTHTIKRVVNKERPNGGDFSFPSGHTSAAFTGAAFIDYKYGLKYGLPAYIFAAFVGWSRVYAKKHDYIDVLGGIIVGVGCVELFTSKTKNYSLNFSYNSQPNIVFSVFLD
ncbi:MAG: phosphatase PAP2 family protein [Flavobacteriales bacterium]|nr:phosphatase PAP2 family protein [Flavobacteriales bacterium]|tara:strand:- start:2502 stop:3032 length:531 start_codon:yes stop_codon:yes gene_type:complete